MSQQCPVTVLWIASGTQITQGEGKVKRFETLLSFRPLQKLIFLVADIFCGLYFCAWWFTKLLMGSWRDPGFPWATLVKAHSGGSAELHPKNTSACPLVSWQSDSGTSSLNLCGTSWKKFPYIAIKTCWWASKSISLGMAHLKMEQSAVGSAWV